MKALILAAGRGERLRPLTDSVPKPLVKLNGEEMILHHIKKLSSAGFHDIYINIDYLGDKIMDRLGDGSEWGVRLHYLDERRSGALESGGAVINALEFLGERFMVVSADIYSDIKYEKDFRLQEGRLAHLTLIPNPPHNLDGDFSYMGARYTFSGIGYYDAKLFLRYAPQKIKIAAILHDAIRHNRVDFSLHRGIWHDIGTARRLQEAKRCLS